MSSKGILKKTKVRADRWGRTEGGNQQLLMQLISEGEVDMASLNDYPVKKLNDILDKVGIDRRDRRK